MKEKEERSIKIDRDHQYLLVSESYDSNPSSGKDQNHIPTYGIPSLKKRLNVEVGDIIAVKSTHSWWIKVEFICTKESGNFNKLSRNAFVPSVICVPIVFDEEVIVESKESVLSEEKQVNFDQFKFPQEFTSKDKKFFPLIFKMCDCAGKFRPVFRNSEHNVFSRRTYTWFDKLILLGYRRTLIDCDIPYVCEDLRTDYLADQFKVKLEKKLASIKTLTEEIDCEKNPDLYSSHKKIEKKENTDKKNRSSEFLMDINNNNNNNSPAELNKDYCIDVKKKQSKRKSKNDKSFLLGMIFCFFRLDFISSIVLKFIYDVLNFVTPFALGKIILYAEELLSSNGKPTYGYWYGFTLALAIFASKVVQTFLLNLYFEKMSFVGLKTKCLLVSIIYQKMLRLNLTADTKVLSGDQMNLVSVDAFKIQNAFTYINVLWSAPLQIILSLAYLATILGLSTLSGCAVLLVIMPLNYFTGKITKKIQNKQMKLKDERMGLVNEVLGGIKLVKLYAWEKFFVNKIMDVRVNELKNLRMLSILNSCFVLVWEVTPLLVSIASFFTFVMIGNDLNASVAFVALSIFGIMRFPLSILPDTINTFIQLKVSISRIEKFLVSEELAKDNVDRYSLKDTKDDSIVMKNASFIWGNDVGQYALENISLSIKKGSSVAIVGKVGSGKTTLINAILGEINKITGDVSIYGTVSYVPQVAWIQNRTLKDNILLNEAYSPEKFKKVIKYCCLEPDIESLDKGELTEIGEKGVNLSGGQKQRISIARSVYNKTDIYLFDDPLSAVDANVAKNLFDDIISNNGILKSKTRVIVTHKEEILPYVDQIIVMDEGRIIDSGNYNELKNKGLFFDDFIVEEPNEEPKLSRTGSIMSQPKKSIAGPQNLKITDYMANIDEKSKSKGIITKEKVGAGKVSFKTYNAYIRAMKYIFPLLAIIFMIATSGTAIGSNIWLAKFSSTGINKTNRFDFFVGYGIFSVCQVVCSFLSTISFTFGAYFASKSLHDKLVTKIMHSPMYFFETTPQGRLINVFSNDIHSVDMSLPSNLRTLLNILIRTLFLFGSVIYYVPYFAIPLALLSVAYYFVQLFFVASSRQMKRIESANKSKILSNYLETYQGCSIIRAYQNQNLFISNFGRSVDDNQSLTIASIYANRWISVRLETIGNILVYFSATFSIIAAIQHNITSGIVGFIISNCANAIQSLNWLVRMRGEVESEIVAVERLINYRKITQEASWLSDIYGEKTLSVWPSRGVIQYTNYSTKYRPELSLSLKGINFETKENEKIGVVGRTGAGKSSLILSLFRIIESVGGSIRIDGIDISKVGLHQLRKKLTVIPQESFIFDSTLRKNLDPLSDFTDEKLWKVLELSHLKSFVESLPDGLEFKITEGGENLSVGQRQLLCLARALLKNTKVLVLDEATASVDAYTDQLIQKTIRNEFNNCTVLTVAHRLNTIIDYDRILVLKDGLCAEFDTPQNLLNNSNSLFYGMARDADLVDRN